VIGMARSRKSNSLGFGTGAITSVVADEKEGCRPSVRVNGRGCQTRGRDRMPRNVSNVGGRASPIGSSMPRVPPRGLQFRFAKPGASTVRVLLGSTGCAPSRPSHRRALPCSAWSIPASQERDRKVDPLFYKSTMGRSSITCCLCMDLRTTSRNSFSSADTERYIYGTLPIHLRGRLTPPFLPHFIACHPNPSKTHT